MRDIKSYIIKSLDTLLDGYPDLSKVFESSYYFDDLNVPRVTKIIRRCIHSEGLMSWANYMGFKHQSYTKILSHAAEVGSQCHARINAFFEPKNKQPMQLLEEANYAYESFNKWYNYVCSIANVKPILHEYTITCKYFGGTLDGLYRINDKVYIIDYKTSNHVDFDYMLQLAAYIFMLEEYEKITIDGAIILQLSKSSIDYNEYALDFNDPKHKEFMNDCKNAFLIMTLWYYYLCYTEYAYNSLHLGGN